MSHVVPVGALAQRRRNRHPTLLKTGEMEELTMIVRWWMSVKPGTIMESG
jgi:hypothetical protein